MLTASIVSDITDAATSAVGDYGLYAVFLLMLVDAVTTAPWWHREAPREWPTPTLPARRARCRSAPLDEEQLLDLDAVLAEIEHRTWPRPGRPLAAGSMHPR